MRSSSGSNRESEATASGAATGSGLLESQGNGSPEIQSSESLEDSETVFLNRSPQSGSQQQQQQSSSSPQPQQQSANNNAITSPSNTNTNTSATTTTPPNPSTTTTEPRKCWICYTDETEESPLNNEWRSPCPCALTAHEACLLDWLADMENPKSRKRNRPAKIQCPQCKADIVVSRPQSMIVDVVRSVERLAGQLVLPGMVFTLAGTVWAGCCAYGVYSIYFVFGEEDSWRIFEGSADGVWNPGLNLGLPLIPLVLIFSRTRYSEGLLPAIPVLFFATHNPGVHELESDLWPPSAAMTFAALPYVKSFYSVLYEKAFGRLERKWISEVQPRLGEDNNEAQPENNDQQGGNARDEGDGDILVEIDLELQLGMGNDNEGDQAEVGEQPAGEQQQGEQAAGEQAQGQAEPQGNQILGRRHDDIIHETGNIADTLLGALLFPAISASVGGVLKMALPRAWTAAPASTLEKGGRVGLLQSRWGRSVVGGCLFVLLKDALVLYCRWKLAQTHRKRKVLNYDRVKKQVVGR